jgi:hypothetical protein
MDNYRCYLTTRAQIFKSFGQDLARDNLHSSVASSDLGDGDPNDCTSCNSDGDGVTFSFHTCLIYGFDFGRVASSFTGSLFSHSFHRG